METCWLVKSLKGDAVFLKDKEQRALDYAAQHGGIMVAMYGESVSLELGRNESSMYGEAFVDSGDIRPARSITCQRNEQLQSDAPGAGPVCEASKST